ncbi:MAG: hypothetical protein ACRESZ_10365 [Methylococcales bacterium]
MSSTTTIYPNWVKIYVATQSAALSCYRAANPMWDVLKFLTRKPDLFRRALLTLAY